MRIEWIALAACAMSAAPAFGQPSSQSAYLSLNRIAEAAALIEDNMCEATEARLFQAALDGVNAMPNDAPPIHLAAPGMDGVADALGPLLTPGADHAAMVQAAISGMARAFDPSAEYIASPQEWIDNDSGVGVLLDGGAGAPFVLSVTDDSPAAHAGVRWGDRLIAIDGQSVEGQRLSEILRRLNGPRGSIVTATISRDGAPISLQIERTQAPRDAAAAVSARMSGDVGIMTVTSFPEGAAPAIRAALLQIEDRARRPAAYILDLRGNAGGLLTEIAEVADLFIDSGGLLTTRGFGACHADEIQPYVARAGDETRGARLFVLIDADTASGAEMLAASLREVRAAVLIGQTSFGQGRVHALIPMRSGRDGYLKLTTALMTTPAGESWDGAGVRPDILTAPRTPGADPALDRALAERR